MAIEQVIETVAEAFSKKRSQALHGNSSWIDGASYDGNTEEMVITMRGRDYVFHGVPEYVYDGLVMAPSPGEYYHSVIKGVYS